MDGIEGSAEKPDFHKRAKVKRKQRRGKSHLPAQNLPSEGAQKSRPALLWAGRLEVWD
jgi:hypothetical protein